MTYVLIIFGLWSSGAALANFWLLTEARNWSEVALYGSGAVLLGLVGLGCFSRLVI